MSDKERYISRKRGCKYPLRGLVNRLNEWKQRIGEAAKGKLHIESYKAYMSTCKSEFWAKRKEAGESYPTRVCQCGVSGRGPNMSRYHFGNCKKVAA